MFKPGELVRVRRDPNKIGTVTRTDTYRQVTVTRLHLLNVWTKDPIPSGDYIRLAYQHAVTHYRLQIHEIISVAEDPETDSIRIKYKQIEVKLWSDTSNSLYCNEHELEHVNNALQERDKSPAYSVRKGQARGAELDNWRE